MLSTDFTILYVADPLKSADFYTGLLGRPPAEASPGFALFVLDKGVKLGLWLMPEVRPAATHTGGGAELAFALPDDAAVDALHGEWLSRGLAIAQPPTRMDFGYTVTALDPDGHRLRAFAYPSE